MPPCFSISPFATEFAMSVQSLKIFFFHSQSFCVSDSSKSVALDCSVGIRIVPVAMRVYLHKPNSRLRLEEKERLGRFLQHCRQILREGGGWCV